MAMEQFKAGFRYNSVLGNEMLRQAVEMLSRGASAENKYKLGLFANGSSLVVKAVVYYCRSVSAITKVFN